MLIKSASERRMEIVNLVNRNNSVRVDDLASLFGVSTVTIRTDLNFLEKNGYIVRSHGVALPNKGMLAELTINEKKQRNVSLKNKIGYEASKLITDNDTIILDSGTTTRAIAENLKAQEIQNTLVFTNSLDVANELVVVDGIELIVSGGRLRKKSHSFAGRQAENTLKHHRFNKLFLGVDGLDIQAGITTHNEDEASLNRLMIQSAQKVIVVTDSTKLDKQSCHVICALSEIDAIIIDSGITEEYCKAFEQCGVEVIIVS